MNVEEQMRGWLAVIGHAKRIEQEIAAYRQLHSLAQEATLLSRNLADFRRVPGLRVEDWTQAQ